MCGISGFVGFEDKQLLQSMARTQHHRGPDDTSYYTSKECSLAQNRLAIIDLKKGIYPVHNEDETIFAVYNGETYNYKELNCKLQTMNHQLYTNCDAETIIHSYEEWDTDFLNKINGMHATAIWDSEKKKLLLARDRVGIKPLYYALVDDGMIFASELKAILQYQKFKISKKALNFYLTFQYVPSPISIFEGVNKLLPGCYLEFQKGKVAVKQYWNPLELYENKQEGTEEFFMKQILNELKASVKRRLMSDVPFGAFLSGGIDSSSVVALMSEIMEEPVKTFSIGFEEKEFDETQYARLVAEKFSTDHHEEFVDSDKLLKTLPLITKYLDEPFGDSSAIPTFLVSALARKHVTMALSGDGGDELFIGYDRYLINHKLSKLPNCILKTTNLLKKLPLKKGQHFIKNMTGDDETRYINFVSIFNEDERKQTLPNETDSNNSNNWMKNIFSEAKNLSLIDKMSYVDMKTYLPEDILVKVDRMSMANSLEARVPILDVNVIKTAVSIPSKFKIHGNEKKYLFKKTMKGILPDNILYRKKAGFAVPIAKWFRNELKGELENTLLNNENIKLDTNYINKLLAGHYSGKHNNSHKLWSLLMLRKWGENFLK